MSVKLRLRRIGRKKVPVFSVIATDSRNARDGRYIEDLGRYYPLEQPAEVRLDEERVLYWLENGAKPSDTVRSILSKRGLMLRHHLKLKGKPEDEIKERVNEHLKQLAEKGQDIKVTAKMRREKALEEERERARQRKEEAQERAQAQEEKAQAEDAEADAEETAAPEAAEAEDEEETEEGDAEEPEAAEEPDEEDADQDADEATDAEDSAESEEEAADEEEAESDEDADDADEEDSDEDESDEEASDDEEKEA